MTDVKMPKPTVLEQQSNGSLVWGHTSEATQQYGDDRAREALDMAALKFETQHIWLTNASAANLIRAREALDMAALKFETQHIWLTNASAANLIRALAKEIK